MKKLIYSLTAIAAITFTSCSDDDSAPEVINEEEVITTLNVYLTSGQESVTLTSYDADGDGPNEPVLSVSGNLAANTTYVGTLEFLNQTVDPVEDITEEIVEESDDHQVFYSYNSFINNVTYTDEDANGFPLGVDFTLTTGDAGEAVLALELIHLPIKDAEGVAEGDSTNAGGGTDFSATFNVTVE